MTFTRPSHVQLISYQTRPIGQLSHRKHLNLDCNKRALPPPDASSGWHPAQRIQRIPHGSQHVSNVLPRASIGSHPFAAALRVTAAVISGHPRGPPHEAAPAQGIAASRHRCGQTPDFAAGARTNAAADGHWSDCTMRSGPCWTRPRFRRLRALACRCPKPRTTTSRCDPRHIRPAPCKRLVSSGGLQRLTTHPPLRLSLGRFGRRPASPAPVCTTAAERGCSEARTRRKPRWPRSHCLAWPLTASSSVCLCSAGRSVSRCSMQWTACARMPF